MSFPSHRALLLVAAALVVSRPGGVPARGDLFTPLLADPEEPGFFATYLFARSLHLARRIGSAGLGQTMGLVRSRTGRWQLAVAAGLFSQFDLASTTTHLMNTDYIIGVPVSYRRGTQSARIRVYHQSSHLGEEFLDGGAVRGWQVVGGPRHRPQSLTGRTASAQAHDLITGETRPARALAMAETKNRRGGFAWS
jgi:hypothetical protein